MDTLLCVEVTREPTEHWAKKANKQQFVKLSRTKKKTVLTLYQGFHRFFLPLLQCPRMDRQSIIADKLFD